MCECIGATTWLAQMISVHLALFWERRQDNLQLCCYRILQRFLFKIVWMPFLFLRLPLTVLALKRLRLSKHAEKRYIKNDKKTSKNKKKEHTPQDKKLFFFLNYTEISTQHMYEILIEWAERKSKSNNAFCILKWIFHSCIFFLTCPTESELLFCFMHVSVVKTTKKDELCRWLYPFTLTHNYHWHEFDESKAKCEVKLTF